MAAFPDGFWPLNRKRLRTWWRRSEPPVFGALALLFVGLCVWGTWRVFRSGGADRLGPLSEWIPGTVTALTLAYTLMSQRRLAREAHENEQRAAADKFHVWLESIEYDSNDDRHVHLVASNTGDAPVYDASSYVVTADDQIGSVSFKTVPPNTVVRQVANIPKFADPNWWTTYQPDYGDVETTFRDPHGTYWHRNETGMLRKYFDVPIAERHPRIQQRLSEEEAGGC